MFSSRKTLYSLAVLGLLLVACSKDISVGQGDTVDNRNIFISTFITHSGAQFSKDSLYEDASGNLYVIDEVKMIISDFYIESRGETFTDTNSFAVVDLTQNRFPLLEVPAGSYSGEYGFRVGLSQSNNAKTPDAFPENSGLRNPVLYRGPIGTYKGYNFVYIQGRTFDPTKPLEVEPSLPFIYELGDTLSLMRSRGKNFTISNDQDAEFDIRIDLDKMLKPFDVYDTDFIQSRPNQPSDYNNAMLLRLQVDSSLVLF